MVVFAANVTEDTAKILEKVLKRDVFVRFALQNNLDLSDKTTYLRLCMINLEKHLPTNEEVTEFKAALLRPGQFDDYWKEKPGVVPS